MAGAEPPLLLTYQIHIPLPSSGVECGELGAVAPPLCAAPAPVAVAPMTAMTAAPAIAAARGGWRGARHRGTLDRRRAGGPQDPSPRRMKLAQSRAKLRRRVRAAVATAAGCALMAAIPAASHAAVTTLGSDLTKPADTVEDHGADAAFWMPTINGASGAMPSNGQIVFVRIKGTVLADPSGRAKPDPLTHIQVLHPI